MMTQKKLTTRKQEKPKSIEGRHETRRAPFSETLFDLYFMSGHAMHQTKMSGFLNTPHPTPSSKSSASYISRFPTGIINRLSPHVRYRWRCHLAISSAVGSQSRSLGDVGGGMAQLTHHSQHQQEWWDNRSIRGPWSNNSITKLDNLHRSNQQTPKRLYTLE